MNMPVNVAVECTDGLCGQSTHLIINPATRKLTHLVVKEISGAHSERLVPLGKVTRSTRNLIHLDCGRAQAETMEEFIEHQSFQIIVPNYTYAAGTYALGAYVLPTRERRLVSVESHHLCPGELDIDQKTRVEATDGYLGRVVELLIEPATGNITHLVVRTGPVWDKRDMLIAISRVAHMEAGTIRLNIDKHFHQAPPAALAQRRQG
jgi:hypothetical protein